MKLRTRVLAVVVAAASVGLGAAPTSDASPGSTKHDDTRAPASTPSAGVGYDGTLDALNGYVDALGRAAWDAAVTEAVDTFVAYLEAGRVTEEQAQAAYAAAVARAASARPVVAATPSSTPVGSTVGECTGFAIPDYIIQRESGGNPSAANPSGAYGCAQTLLSHYSGGGVCAGLNPYAIDGQRQCVAILSNNGTNLAPWATG